MLILEDIFKAMPDELECSLMSEQEWIDRRMENYKRNWNHDKFQIT